MSTEIPENNDHGSTTDKGWFAQRAITAAAEINRRRVAAVPLDAWQLLGLLNGTLRVDPLGPQLPADAELYLFNDGEAITRRTIKPCTKCGVVDHAQHDAEYQGIMLGVRALTLDPVGEGGPMPTLPIQFTTTHIPARGVVQAAWDLHKAGLLREAAQVRKAGNATAAQTHVE